MNVCKYSLLLVQVDILMLSWLSHPRYLSDIWYEIYNRNIWNSYSWVFIIWKNSTRNDLLINQSIFQTKQILQTKKKASIEFRLLLFDNNLVATTNMIYSVFKLFNSNILPCTFSETAAMAVLSIWTTGNHANEQNIVKCYAIKRNAELLIYIIFWWTSLQKNYFYISYCRNWFIWLANAIGVSLHLYLEWMKTELFCWQIAKRLNISLIKSLISVVRKITHLNLLLHYDL